MLLQMQQAADTSLGVRSADLSDLLRGAGRASVSYKATDS